MAYFYMERGWERNECFTSNDDRYAWVWLIGNACFSDKTVGVMGKPINLTRGQLCYSIRFLAQVWCVSPKRARTILEKLENWAMIRIEKGKYGDKYGSIITICNYDKYQDKSTTEGKDAGKKRASKWATKGQEEGTNNKEVIKEGLKEDKGIVIPDFINSQNWNDFVEHRRQMKKPLTERAIIATIQKLTDWHKAGLNANDALMASVANGWQGIFEPKSQKKKMLLT
jgi:hypothetical protein